MTRARILLQPDLLLNDVIHTAIVTPTRSAGPEIVDIAVGAPGVGVDVGIRAPLPHLGVTVLAEAVDDIALHLVQ